jgi:hypothetical protein
MTFPRISRTTTAKRVCEAPDARCSRCDGFGYTKAFGELVARVCDVCGGCGRRNAGVQEEAVTTNIGGEE